MRGNNGLAQLNVRVTIPEGRELRTEFCIEIDSELLAGQVHRILKLACKERNWDIPPPPPPLIKDGRGKEPIIERPNQDISVKTVTILSEHRSPISQSKPLTLTKRQILFLLESSLSPDYLQDKLNQELASSLRELEAKGEIYAGVGNRFCIAYPTILYEEALFVGDRAYLPLAHLALGNPVTETNKLIFPDLNFEVLQQKFLECGINLITIEQGLEHLPETILPLT